MAESNKTKKTPTPDSFADDLDSMLNLDAASEQQVGLVDEDDAIDRLLMGDAFADGEAVSGDIDHLFAEQPNQDDTAADFDEFADDFMPDFQIKPAEAKAHVDADIVPFDAVEDEQPIDISVLEQVGDIDEFADDEPVMPDFNTKPVAGTGPADVLTDTAEIDEFADDAPIMPDFEAAAIDDSGQPDVLEGMTEIDEFADQETSFGSDKADFLLADFDISADDEPKPVPTEPASAAPTIVTQAQPSELDDLDLDAFGDDVQADDLPQAATLTAPETPPNPGYRPDPEQAALLAKLGAELAELSTHFHELKKQHLHVKQQLQFKSNQDDLHTCQETLDTLQTEQKKLKRGVDALEGRKPVLAYVANGVAVLALLTCAGLAFQNYVTKVQLEQLIEFAGKLQTQITAAPTADAADKEMVRKQLEELALADTVAAKQIADLTQAMQGQAAPAAGGSDKQWQDLSNQNMQIGAAIEALQSKVAALEKGRVVAAVPKPVVKKPPVVVEENWAVNLVAFKQDWYAKRKAEEYAGKGVSAHVVKADAKGETWYRLVVDGFKSQYDAAAYAARVKKTLNLDAVTVAKVNH